MTERPLSPHLSIYRFAYTMSLSILHRITGVALSVTFIGFVIWLIGMALGPDAYAALLPALHSWPVQILIALTLLALVYHFCNGVRHLFWDAGLGYERHQARRSAALVVVATVIIFAVCLYFLIHRWVASP